MKLEWEPYVSPPTCGARRGGRRSRTFCELPPDHVTGRATDTVILEYNHIGRTPSGRWYSWAPKTKEIKK